MICSSGTYKEQTKCVTTFELYSSQCYNRFILELTQISFNTGHGRMTANKVESLWKEAAMIYFKELPQNLSTETVSNHKTSVRIVTKPRLNPLFALINAMRIKRG